MKLQLAGIVFFITLFNTSSLLANDSDKSHILLKERVLIEAHDLQALGKTMRSDQLGLVIMFHAEYCEYCKRLEADLLQPMLRSGDYDDKVLIRKIQIDGAYNMVNFNGQKIAASQLATLYDASMTPTLVFVDANGDELAQKLLGYTSPDFFGAYLDRAIAQLHRAVLKQSQ
jgi:thioredoxin-related protein